MQSLGKASRAAGQLQQSKQEWRSDLGRQEVPPCQPLDSSGPHGARMWPGKPCLGSWESGLDRKPQADPQSPILVLSACSREGSRQEMCGSLDILHWNLRAGRGAASLHLVLLPSFQAALPRRWSSSSPELPSSPQPVTVYFCDLLSQMPGHMFPQSAERASTERGRRTHRQVLVVGEEEERGPGRCQAMS